MGDRRRARLRPAPRAGHRGRAAMAVVILAVAVGACATSPSPSPSEPASAAPSPSPTATPQPTHRFSNEPDPTLAALIPDLVGDRAVVKPPMTDYAITPGDIGLAAYGDLGARFETLVIAFIREPRLSLYAMRVDGPPVSAADLEPYLATAGRYVGIAGLDREPWQLVDVAGHWVWVRPSDNATLPGTRVYTWAADEYVFLMIGVSDDLNQALLALLPGEAPPTPTPAPSGSPGATGPTEPVPSPSGT